MNEPCKRVFEVCRRRGGRQLYVDTLLTASLEEAEAVARSMHGADVIVIDVLAERQRAREQSLSTEGSSAMKKDDVKVGQAYVVKVSGKLADVRLDEEHPQGGWVGTNLKTGKRVRIKSARRLRGEAGQAAPAAPQAARVAKKTGGKSQDAKGQNNVESAEVLNRVPAEFAHKELAAAAVLPPGRFNIGAAHVEPDVVEFGHEFEDSPHTAADVQHTVSITCANVFIRQFTVACGRAY